MKTFLTLAAAALLALAACSKPGEPARPADATGVRSQDRVETGIAWKHASNNAEVDAAFAQAREQKKPLFLYWGAAWCPPCNQLKATLFNRADFIERSRAFVPVYIDGDSPGAQKLGTRFKARGYPTMVLFGPDGVELTRLPGEVDAAQYTQVLTLGMNAQRPAKAVLAAARGEGGGTGLTPSDWKLLAFYSWETDEQQLVPKEQVPALLKQLAAACPAQQGDTSTRLLLKSLAAAADDKTLPPPDAAARERVLRLLANPVAARAQMDVLTNEAAEIVRALAPPKTPQREELVDAFNAALKWLEDDPTLSRADRLTALIAQVTLAKIDAPKNAKTAPALPATLLEAVRGHAARVDREVTDGYERQAVITTAAYLLAQAGLVDESDAMLKTNLAKSHSPYYLMSSLASNAKKRGDTASALHWSEEAFNKSQGPATRLQWGASHVQTLVELAPGDEARIERAVQQLLGEAAAQPNAFYERSARSLERVGRDLVTWNQGQAHAAVMERLQAQLDGVCRRLPADDVQRGVCDRLFRPADATQKAVSSVPSERIT